MLYSAIDYKQIPADEEAFRMYSKTSKQKWTVCIQKTREHDPSGNLNSCALDLCHWIMHNLSIYHHPDDFQGVLQSSTLQNMTGRLLHKTKKYPSD